MYEMLKEQMRGFYDTMNEPETNVNFKAVRDIIAGEMDEFYAVNPNASAFLLKSRLHQSISDHFQPVIFSESPFFYEMGLRASKNWGTPDPSAPSNWLINSRSDLLNGTIQQNINSFERGGVGMTGWNSVFDIDHHCLGYSEIFSSGINGIIDYIRSEAYDGDYEKKVFCQAAEQSCISLLNIAEKFALKADELLVSGNYSKRQEKFLRMIAETARRVPAQPPQTFYEGLAALWFLREAVATLEGIGISVIGHLDRLLDPLYEEDLRSGRITESEARDLLAMWMMPTDIKFELYKSNWPETSTCAEVGGCDAEGTPVWNAVTRMILDVHEKQGFINPKLNCRFSSDSPKEYLDAVSGSILRGHNNFTLINDGVLIPALVKSGKSLEEARLYVNGGCQETMTEGVEHSAGAFYYFSLPRVFDICLLGKPDIPSEVCGPQTVESMPDLIEDSETFEEFYLSFFEELKKSLSAGTEWRRILGEHWSEIHPCPLFSATLKGCVKSGTDYTAGGAKYNPSTVCAFGLATLIDSLYAVKKSVYDEKLLKLGELRGILHSNWENNEPLRHKLIVYPKFGHGIDEIDELAARFIKDLSSFVSTLPNERGGHYQLSMFVYYAYELFSHHVRATPDGRKCGDLLSQGVAPYRLNRVKSITDSIRSLGKIDFTDLPGNSVLDVLLPVGSSINAGVLTGLVQAFARLGGPTLQPNMVSREELLDAKIYPEKHKNLVVRICGLSAYFVALTPAIQDEIINRNFYEA